MNVEAAMMNVPWHEAQDAYRNYRIAIKENRATKDDVAISRAYHALMRGKKVIDIGLAIAGGGVDDQTRPRLAVARADWERVFCRRDDDGKFRFTSRSGSWGRRPGGEIAVRIGDAPRMVGQYPNNRIVGEGVAQVPTIPPQFRPKDALAGYHILFEAVWQRSPTRDPMLLKQIGDGESPLFVVLAAWDLTPLEQAVLRAKL